MLQTKNFFILPVNWEYLQKISDINIYKGPCIREYLFIEVILFCKALYIQYYILHEDTAVIKKDILVFPENKLYNTI